MTRGRQYQRATLAANAKEQFIERVPRLTSAEIIVGLKQTAQQVGYVWHSGLRLLCGVQLG